MSKRGDFEKNLSKKATLEKESFTFKNRSLYLQEDDAKISTEAKKVFLHEKIDYGKLRRMPDERLFEQGHRSREEKERK